MTWTAGCWTPSRRGRAGLPLHPNNPTGRLVDGALLRAAAEQCRAVGAVLAVDECFLPLSDGAGPGLAPCLAEHPNLLLLRAFTKSYAMAGLRLGYALSANGGLLERMAAAGPPWSVSTPAQAAGLAALEQCSDWPEKARALLASERPALSDGLAALGLEVVPGQANYLLFRAAGAADLNDRILTRACSSAPAPTTTAWGTTGTGCAWDRRNKTGGCWPP